MAANSNLLRLLLRHHLVNDDGVQALVGGNIAGAHLEDADAATALLADGPALVFQFLSGVQRWHGAVQIQTFELWAYSRTSQHDAAGVYSAANEALQHECLKITGIEISAGVPLSGICQEVQRPVEGFNSVLAAWFCRGRWKFGGTG